MKKIFILALVVVLAFSCSAFADGLKIGVLAKDTTENAFTEQVAACWKWSVLGSGHGDDDTFKYYDDLTSLLLALDNGDIDEIDLPSIVAEYIIAVNPKYKVSCVMREDHRMNFVLGFLKDKNEALCNEFNEAILGMQRDGTLQELQVKYVDYAGKSEPESVKFESFPNAKTVRIAVTGDIPPIDYMAADGQAAGFNASLLAEIGRRLKINIELINVNALSRTVALVSGRADVVFWYMMDNDKKVFDIPDNVVLSIPYYTFETYLQIRKK